jgi:D-cysteine desulfhydrase family pyridoxal phosphate-dependent enzyme
VDKSKLISPEELKARIDRLPRIKLGYFPTPLDDCPRLTKAIGGPPILMKRDDLTGLAFGGNKTRQLEFMMADALSKGADVVVAGAYTQSNFCRQTAAAARKLGLDVVLVLRQGEKGPEPQGNMLLFRLLGADIRVLERSEDSEHPMAKYEEVAEELRRKGRKPYIVNKARELGAVSYVGCILELWDQIRQRNLKVDYLFSSAADMTQAGLALGAKAIGAPFKVVGITPIRWKTPRAVDIADLANRTAELLEIDVKLKPEEIANHDDYVGPRYGVVTEEGRKAIELLARTEGIFLDPVYTSKAMAGLIDFIRKGKIGSDRTVVFLHTGGTPALFSYNKEVLGT